MKFTKLGRAAVIAAVGATLLASCAANEGGSSDSGDDTGSTSTLSGTISGVGASSTGAAQEAWRAAFQTANPDVTVDYDPAGSSAGREQFIAGGSDFGGSDSPLSEEELAGEFAACAPEGSPIDVPIYVSPIAIIFNLDGVDELNLDAATAAAIFKGDITNWNDPAIAALNEGATLPDQAITAVHRADGSGTTKNFAEWLSANAPEVWDAEAEDEFPYQAGEGATGTSGVVDAVAGGSGTIGYADASRAGDLGVAAIKVGEEFVNYSPEAAAAVVDASPLLEGDRPEGDLAFDIDRTTTEAGVYPLVLVSYALVCTEYADAEAGELAKAYIAWVASDEGQQVAAESAGAAPLSADLQAKVAESLGVSE